jgi:hypothetical protein
MEECGDRALIIALGEDGGYGDAHKRRNGVNGDDTERPEWLVASPGGELAV